MLVERIPAIVFSANLDQPYRTLYVSPQLESMLGFTPSEFVAEDGWLRQLHPDDRERVLSGIAESRETGAPFAAEFRFLARDGRVVWVRAEASVVRGPGDEPAFLQGVLLDISQRRRTEEVANALARVGHGLTEALDLEVVSRRISTSVRLLLDAVASGVYELDPESGSLKALAFTGDIGAALGPKVVFPAGNGAVGLALRERRVIVTPDCLEDPRIVFTRDIRARIEQAPFRSVLAVPLVVKDRVIGALGIGDKAGRVFDAEAIRLAQAFADQAALALENARLYEDAERRRREAERHNRELAILNAVGRAVSSSLESPVVFRTLQKLLQEHLDLPGGAILLYDQALDRLSVEAGWGLPPPALHELMADPLVRADNEQVIQEREAVARDLREIPPGAGPGGTGFPREWRSYLCVPLLAKGVVQGVLDLFGDAPGVFGDNEVAFFRTMGREIGVAIYNARLFEEVRAGRERLQALSRRLVEVQEAERRHIGRELHDEIGQILTGLQLSLDTSPGLPADIVGDRLRRAQSLVSELLSRVREMSLDLRPAVLDDLGLLPALLRQFGRYTARTGVKVRFEQTGLERRVGAEAEAAAFRIVQEALTNVARHAAVAEVTVRVWTNQNSLNVQIEDRGRGFDPETVLAERTSTGLAGMRERAAAAGGHLSVESAPGAGTCLTAELPLEDSP